CGAALAAAKAGAQVTLIEKSDMLIGAGFRAGQMSHAKLVAAEEMKALGQGDLNMITVECSGT
ncbi:MAG: FAD-dependent oxidoreductase, partial [Dehalococcoidia bacterium]|nr:FAD-dependent oxidoreductase [Dehalococcoidia bacterium]